MAKDPNKSTAPAKHRQDRLSRLGLRPVSTEKDPHLASRHIIIAVDKKIAAIAAVFVMLSAAAVVIAVFGSAIIGTMSANDRQEELLERFDELTAAPPEWAVDPVSSGQSIDVQVHQTNGGYTVTGDFEVYAPATTSPIADQQATPDPPSVTTQPEPPVPEIYMDQLEYGSPVSIIRIKRLNAEYVVQVGTDTETLKDGPGLWKYGSVPGMPGNATIAGHRTTYGAPFRHIDKLVPGDIIEIVTPGLGVSSYEVRETQTVRPTDTGVTKPGPGVRLTLTTCHPVGSAEERLVVQAEMIEGVYANEALPPQSWDFRI